MLRTSLKKTTSLVAVFFFFLISFASGQKKHLFLPVDFMIENGSINKTTVKVLKNGAVAFSIPGRHSMKLKLDFNNDYVLSFSKEGYITKSIAVSTFVPDDRILQPFEPYKIGVRIFRQYEGVNIVVYSQPVARIHYNPSVDDIDYDVDYTKSILSVLSATEQELEIKAAEERKVTGSSQHVKFDNFEEAEKSSKNSENDLSVKSSGRSISGNTNINKPMREPLQNDEISSPSSGNGKEINQQIEKNGGADHGNELTQNKGDETSSVNNTTEGESPENKVSITEATDMVSGPVGSGDEELHNAALIAGRGFDRGAEINNERGIDIYSETVKGTSNAVYFKTQWKESNRTVTLIKVVNGAKASEYRKVDYNWGGIYYFKDLHYNISQDVYEWVTGEK